MAYEIIDNFLPEAEAQNLENVLLGVDFPWYYNPAVIDTPENLLTDYQFVHGFYKNWTWNSSFAPLVMPIMERINPTSIIRVKANLNPYTGEHVYGGWHHDYKFTCKTAVYYVNDNNGWTEFENGERVESKANRLVVFDSDMLHTGVSATDVKARCLININYLKAGE